jgi:hypothetical protein
MQEFTLDDGRKAEKVENNVDPMTKVTEIYVEPKQEKKLSQRITERFCVCEREIETIDESTGEVVGRVVENLREGVSRQTVEKKFSGVFSAVEKKVSDKNKIFNTVFVVAIVAQLAILAYVLLS